MYSPLLVSVMVTTEIYSIDLRDGRLTNVSNNDAPDFDPRVVAGR